MTNYNDGNWHPWTGGERPVHPKTNVDVLFTDGCTSEGLEAEDWEWSHDQGISDIVAFCVVEEFKEPRTFWGFFDLESGHWEINRDRDEAWFRHDHKEGPLIELREVLE